MFSKIWGFLKSFVSNAVKELWDMIKSAFQGELDKFLAEIKDIAISVIKEVKDLGLKDEEARKKAVELLKEALVDCGIKFKDSWINVATEIFYQIVKKSGI